jgi:hypothetical protein
LKMGFKRQGNEMFIAAQNILPSSCPLWFIVLRFSIAAIVVLLAIFLDNSSYNRRDFFNAISTF